MRVLRFSLLFSILLLVAALLWRPLETRIMTTSSSTNHPTALTLARQLVLVTTVDWSAVTGVLQRFERGEPSQTWKPIGIAIPIVVGRNGMGWGRGLHGAPKGPGPIKREGDGKAPAGIFRLSAAFGYVSRQDARNVKLPYTQSLATSECVDDVESTHYNRILDRSQTATTDWKSSEQMRRTDDLYRWGVVVDHNAGTPVPGSGSCIFLHIWISPSTGTSGCTAMEPARIEELLDWLDPAASPVLVQLPGGEATRLRTAWDLPLLDQQR
jgi:D-alanyl-D-alanine dipeptidase